LLQQTADFPALEVSLPESNNSKPTSSSNKPSARVLVIKSSTTQSRGKKASSGAPVWDKIAAIAESKIKERNNSAFPSLATAAETTTNNNVWKGSEPQFVQSSSRSESTSSSVNSSTTINTSPYTTAFVRGKPTRTENNEFPGLPSTSMPSKSKSNGPEKKSAWGQGGAFTSIASENNQNENDSEDDSSYSESAKEGGKKKKKKKTVLFHNSLF